MDCDEKFVILPLSPNLAFLSESDGGGDANGDGIGDVRNASTVVLKDLFISSLFTRLILIFKSVPCVGN